MAAAAANTKDAGEDLKSIHKRIECVSSETIKFLKTRPWWDKAFDALQAMTVKLVPNTHVVAHPDSVSVVCAKLLCASNESHSQTIVNDTKDVMIKTGKQGDCHNNVGQLFQKGTVGQWIIGFALSEDGLWRHHSWGIKDGQLVETTEVRLIYLGVDVNRLPSVS